jgi:hypothetical protein
LTVHGGDKGAQRDTRLETLVSRVDAVSAESALLGADFDEVREALEIIPRRALLVIDSLQLTPPPRAAARLDERIALAVRALKGLAVERDLAILALAQLSRHRSGRSDPRPTLDDLGGLGAIKQNADVVLAIYREEMYRPGQGGRRCDRAHHREEPEWANRIHRFVFPSALAPVRVSVGPLYLSVSTS